MKTAENRNKPYSMSEISLHCVMVILFTALGVSNVYAQNDSLIEEDQQLKRPVQLSLVYPLGTNGVEAYKYTNNISVNIIAGLSGGVEGAEGAGFVNLTDGDILGVQGAGFANLSKGTVTGVQGAGFINGNDGDIIGVQGAGFANFAKGKVYGIQGAGFTNIALDSVLVGQGSGFYNHAHGPVTGIQGAGFANFAKGAVQGVQGSGFANLGMGSVTGVQGAGFANVSLGKLSGIQGAGFANIVTDSMVGLQASGFVNYAQEVEGFQIGVFNYCDSISDGIPIGFLSIVRHGGYQHFEIEANETMYVNAAFKIGVDRFYNIFSAHARPAADSLIWGIGYGFGTVVPLPNAWALNIDAQCAQLNQNAVFTDKVNLLNTLKVHLNYSLAEHLTLFGGPKLNVLVRDAELASSLQYKSYSWEADNHFVDLNLGACIGVRF